MLHRPVQICTQKLRIGHETIADQLSIVTTSGNLRLTAPYAFGLRAFPGMARSSWSTFYSSRAMAAAAFVKIEVATTSPCAALSTLTALSPVQLIASFEVLGMPPFPDILQRPIGSVKSEYM